MTERPIEFIVVGTERAGEPGIVRAVGRCGAEAIRRGDRFGAAFRYRLREAPDPLGEDAERDEGVEVCLEVRRIRAYGDDLDEMGPGMTGEIELSGRDVGIVGPGCILGQPAEVPATRSMLGDRGRNVVA